jgi:hypothetical protein
MIRTTDREVCSYTLIAGKSAANPGTLHAKDPAHIATIAATLLFMLRLTDFP